jgi:hypoxanthine phosphoribosyltransferase
MPPSTPPTRFNPEGESTARKIIIREMDHPIQILFFAGHLLNEDEAIPIDFIVNTLSGATEIGYALKSIYSLLGINKIKDVFLLKFSKYGEADKPQPTLESFVPKQLVSELCFLRNKRLLIVDDNTFSGYTLYELKKMCEYYSDFVGIAAIERRTDITISEKQIIEWADLNITPISKLRYIGKVLGFVKNNNLQNFNSK